VTGEGRKNPTEDLITSAVFGPLAYFGAAAVPFLDAIIQQADFEPPASLCGEDQIQFLFWERWKDAKSGQAYVEPDLVIEIRSGTQLYIIIVEIKWGAPFHENQLQIQWNTAQSIYGGAAEPVELRHLLIVRTFNESDDRQYREHWLSHKRKVGRLTWQELSEAVKSLRSVDGGLGLWANDVCAFLTRNGIRTQSGWPLLGLTHEISSYPHFADALLRDHPGAQKGWCLRPLGAYTSQVTKPTRPKQLFTQRQIGWEEREITQNESVKNND